MTMDESNPAPRHRKEPDRPIIEGQAKVLAEEPVSGSAETEASLETAAKATEEPEGPPGAAPFDPPPGTTAPPVDAPAGKGDREVKSARKSRLPLFAAGGIFLGLVATAVAWFGPFADNKPDLARDERVSALDTRVTSVEQKIALLDQRITTSEASQRQAMDAVAATSKKLDDVNSGLGESMNAAKAAAAASQAAQADATRALTTKSEPAPAAIDKPVDIQPLEDRLARVEAKLSEPKSEPAPTATEKPVDIQPLEDRLARVEAKLAEPKLEGRATVDRVPAPSNPSLDNAAAQAVVAQSLLQTIDQGLPFSRHVAALETLGADSSALAVLKPFAETGVPRLSSLSDRFSRVAGQIAAGDNRAKDGENFFDRAWRNITGLVRVRPLGDAPGEDPGALAARIESALARQNASDALADWEKLPAFAQGLSQDWHHDLKSRVDVETAATTILTAAIASLGKPKS
jgi:hypothetical protein